MNRILLFLLAVILFSSQSSCFKNKKEKKDKKEKTEKINDLSPQTPVLSNVIDMPKELKEISGISFIDDNNLVAIEDEEGILYYYNIDQKKVTRTKPFGGSADYEDVTVAKDDIYVVDSSGKLYLIANYKTNTGKAQIISTSFTEKNDIEGLTYDAANNRLLIAPKADGLKDDENVKEIYAFDLKTKQLNTTPVYSISLAAIEEYFKGDGLEESSKKFLKAVGNENMNKIFRTSALAINPATKEIFILSSINNIIAILSPDGKLVKILQLKGKEFTQPEGIAFTPEGNLYISNEGNKNKGNILHMIYEN